MKDIQIEADKLVKKLINVMPDKTEDELKSLLLDFSDEILDNISFLISNSEDRYRESRAFGEEDEDAFNEYRYYDILSEDIYNFYKTFNIKDLAVKLDNFMYEIDFYNYTDAFNDREEGLNETINELNDKPEDVIAWLKEYDYENLTSDQKIVYNEIIDGINIIINNKSSQNLKKENKIMANENLGWVIIPKMSVSTKVRVVKDKDGKDHKKVSVFLPEKDGKKMGFSILEGQAIPSKELPFDELVQIPVNEYGIDLFEVKNKEDLTENDKPVHMAGKEAFDFLKTTYKNLNNPEVKYIKLPASCVTDSKDIENAEKKFASVKLPSYMKARDGFTFNGAEFYAQKAYHTKDKNGNDLRAIQCLPDEKAIFQVKNFGKQIDVKAMDLFKYNNEDYLKSLNKDNEKPLDSAKSIKDKQPQEESKPENKPASQTKKNENTR